MSFPQSLWQPYEPAERRLEALIADGAKVLDVGANPNHKFSKATATIGWQGDYDLDLNCDPFPFADNEFDFVYCRDTLEDLHWPFHAIGEMTRVGKAGFIGTPSPMAELCHGVDNPDHGMRGYCHHRWIFATHGAELFVAAKYPLVDRIAFPDFRSQLEANPALGHNFFLWQTKPVHAQFIQHEREFLLNSPSTYARALVKLAAFSTDHTLKEWSQG